MILSTKAKKTANLFASGVLILTVCNLLVKVIGALLKVPLNNLIGEAGMGLYTPAYKVYVWLYMISTAGLPVAISVMISETRAKGNLREPKKIFKVSMLLFTIIGFVGTCLLIGFSSFLANEVYKLPGMEYPIIGIAPTLFLICIVCCIKGYFQGFQIMAPSAISEVIESLGKLAIGLGLAYFVMNSLSDNDILGNAKVAGASIVGVTAGVAISLVYLIIKKARFREEIYDEEFLRPDSFDMPLRSSKEIMKKLIVIAIPITIGSSILSLMSVLDDIIISNRLQSIFYSSEQVTEILGYFNAQVITFFNLPPALIYPISGSIVPYLSNLNAQGDRIKSKAIMNSSLKVASLIALPCALGMSVLSKPIINLLFKSHYLDDAARLLSVQSLSIFFVAMLAMTTSILQAHGYERKPIISMLAGASVKLASSWLLIGNENIAMLGAPIGTFLCYLTIILFNFWFVAKYVGFIPDVKNVFLRPLISSVVCAGGALGAYKISTLFAGEKISVVIAIIFAALLYFAALFLTRTLEKDDFAIIPKGDKIYDLLKRKKLIK